MLKTSSYLNGKRSNSSKLMFFMSLIVSFYMLSGYMGEIKNYISLFLVIAWNFVAFITTPKMFNKMINSKIMYIFLWYLIVYFLLLIVSSGIIHTTKYIGVALINFWPLLLFLYYSKSQYYKDVYYITIITIIFWMVVCIFSIVYYINYPSAARLLAADSSYYGNITFVGGYGIAFGSAILNSYILDLLKNSGIYKKTTKLIGYVMIIVMTVMIIKTESVITIIINFVGLIIVLFRNKSRRLYQNILVVNIIAIILLLAFVNRESIGRWVIEKTTTQDYNVILSRINEIGYKIAYGSNSVNSSDLDQRMGNILDSIILFLKSPLIGQGYKYGFDFMKGKALGIGAHCEWVDVLAEIGLLGGVAFLALYWNIYKIERYYSQKERSSTYILVVFLLGLLNPFRTLHSQFVLFYLVPSISYLQYYKSNTTQDERKMV